MKSRILVALALLALGVGLAAPALAAAPHPSDQPRHTLRNGTSTNWSGYAVDAQNVTDVRGTWVVPAVDCAGVQDQAASSVWVGIDGDTNNTVEQTGTDQLCDGQHAVSDAWIEMYPSMGRTLIKLPVHPGDRISAEVQWLKTQVFSLRLTNETTGQRFQTQTGHHAAKASAEWIVECPGTPGVLPLADFGTARFSNASATIGGTTGPINAKPWADAVEPITMVAADETTVRAVPSGLRQSGSGFSVTWQHR
ncbi:MAG TPA: G1 family glutamic endopeptidase [Nitrolancea sp.]|nr:G1 family glutamic endopeptidase [Nitrolancea sp.]